MAANEVVERIATEFNTVRTEATAIDNKTIINAKKDLSIVHNITADEDYTLTTIQNQYGRIEITDTGTTLTGAINIIMNDDEHTFLFVNSTLQTLTVKTSTGTGIAINNDSYTQLRNDETNIIEAKIISDNLIGISYTDSDAIGANPTAKIYPNGTIIGSTDNGSYIKYPNGKLECSIQKSVGATSSGNIVFPIAFRDILYHCNIVDYYGGTSDYKIWCEKETATNIAWTSTANAYGIGKWK